MWLRMLSLVSRSKESRERIDFTKMYVFLNITISFQFLIKKCNYERRPKSLYTDYTQHYKNTTWRLVRHTLEYS